MDNDKIVDAFDKFVDDKFADSEDILRDQIKHAVNDHLKNKLSLEKNPVEGINNDPDDNKDNEDQDE